MAKKFEFTKEILKDIEDMAARGLYEKDIAYNIGLDPTTLSRKKRTEAQLDQAIKKGAASGAKIISNIIFEKAQSGNLIAAMFFAKCRMGWREVEQVSTTEAPETVEI